MKSRKRKNRLPAGKEGNAGPLSPGPEGQGFSSPLFTIALSASAALIYLGSPSSHYNADGVVFSLWVERAISAGEFGPLWHPRHLVYAPLGYLFCEGLHLVGISLRAVYLLRLFDLLLASAAVALFHRFSLRLTGDRLVSLLVSLLFTFSFGQWWSAVEAEVYALNTLIWIGGLYTAWHWSRQEHPGPPFSRAVLLGFIAAVALAAHITSGLLLAPLLWTAWRHLVRPSDKGSVLKKGAVVVAAGVVWLSVVAGMYWFAYRVNPLAEGQSFWGWVRGEYNPLTGFGYPSSYWMFSGEAGRKWLVGMSRTFLAGPSFRYVEHPLWSWLQAGTLAGLIAGLSLYLIHLRHLLHRDRPAQELLAFAFFPLALFSLFWEPANFEIKIVLLPSLWLMAGQGAAEVRRRLSPGRARTLAAGLAAIGLFLFTHNFCASFRPGSDPKFNPDLERAYFIAQHTEPNAVIYLAGFPEGYNMGKFYLPYFAERQTRVVDWILRRSPDKFPRPLLASFFQDRNRPAYVLSELLEDGPVLARLSREHQIEPGAVIRLFQSFQPKLVSQRDDGFALYRLTLSPE